MKIKPPIKISWARFASCSGCQLMLVNCEASLASLAEVAGFHDFTMVSSLRDPRQMIDIALVEGSVTSPTEIERLLALRRKSHLLVAVGACALSGGVNTLVKGERRRALVSVYGSPGQEWDSFPPQPVHHFVKVDGQIHGCPPERHELQESLASLLLGGWPVRQVMPVCMECRSCEYRCLLQEDHAPCLGPVTFAGCHAKCPGVGVPCEGCRGLVPEANRDELYRLLLGNGLTEQVIRRRMQRFGEEYHDPVDR